MPILTVAERIGTEIDGKYSVEGVLAQGGMGVVFEATHLWTGRKVAIKLLRPDLGATEQVPSARLVAEARTTTRLSHPNVVQVLDMGETEDGLPYLVMERLHGRTLRDVLLAQGPLSPEETLRLLVPVLGAMAVAHDLGIVHRDLKPANILLATQGAGPVVPKVLDFGIAKLVQETGITSSGAVLGTPHYLSPEQAAGDDDVGPASDIWALGVIFFQCLTGRLPFEGGDASSVLRRVLHEQPPTLDRYLPHLNSSFAAAVERATRREPAARYPNARSFAHALALTAATSGIALQAAPDPVGLPDWPSWCSTEAIALSSTAPGHRKAAVTESSAVHAAGQTTTAAAAPAPTPARSKLAVALATTLILATLLGLAWLRFGGARESSASATPAAAIPQSASARAVNADPAARSASPLPPAPEAAQISVQAAAAATAAEPAQPEFAREPAPASAAPAKTAEPNAKRRTARKLTSTASQPTTPTPAPRTADRMMHSW